MASARCASMAKWTRSSTRVDTCACAPAAACGSRGRLGPAAPSAGAPSRTSLRSTGRSLARDGPWLEQGHLSEAPLGWATTMATREPKGSGHLVCHSPWWARRDWWARPWGSEPRRGLLLPQECFAHKGRPKSKLRNCLADRPSLRRPLGWETASSVQCFLLGVG